MANAYGKIKKNNYLVKSNYFIEASYKLSLQEHRITYILTTKIEKNDEEFKPYRFSSKEITNILKNHKFTMAELIKTIDSLRNKELVIRKESSVLTTKWLSSAEYFDDGTMELCFDTKLKPYLLQLKDKFTSLDFDNAIKFKSTYSIRMYELLKQYKAIGERVLEIEDLREKFCIGENEYERYNDFKRKIIIQAQNEINKNTEISFDYEEIKKGKKIVAIKFKINSKSSEKEMLKNGESVALPEDVVKVPVDEVAVSIAAIPLELLKRASDIMEIELSESELKDIIVTAKGDLDLIQRNYNYMLTQKDIRNTQSWILNAVREDYAKGIKGYKKGPEIRPGDSSKRKYSEVELEEMLLRGNIDIKVDENIIKSCENCAVNRNGKCMFNESNENGVCDTWRNEKIS
ncbi:MAG: replication initiation protein [Clostridiaceae bacterium]|nr:replication initiation protein [Clostridiaceae bacterium]